ncbi:hypothetical protein FOL47_002592 [Perkinsus chesapeaki]|uniref:Uncharacterized protein n=1 Tax=Perkinsus chesapeaki TaxID=330153 RepID=A0A7J6MDY6_PERCH|nr:hypothetical protein FOL47_002592 [Perkinsus chesapeaki]
MDIRHGHSVLFWSSIIALWLIQPVSVFLAYLHYIAFNYDIKEENELDLYASQGASFTFYGIGLNPRIVKLDPWLVNRPWYAVWYLILATIVSIYALYLLLPLRLRSILGRGVNHKIAVWMHEVFHFDKIHAGGKVVLKIIDHDSSGFWGKLYKAERFQLFLQVLLLIEYGGFSLLPPREVEPSTPLVFFVQSCLLGSTVLCHTLGYYFSHALFSLGADCIINVLFVVSKLIWAYEVYDITSDPLACSFSLSDPSVLSVLTSTQNILVASARAGYVYTFLIKERRGSYAVAPEPVDVNSANRSNEEVLSSFPQPTRKRRLRQALRLAVVSCVFFLVGIIWFAVIDKCSASDTCAAPSRTPFSEKSCGCKTLHVGNCSLPVEEMFAEKWVEHVWIISADVNDPYCYQFNDTHLEYLYKHHGDHMKSIGMDSTAVTQWEYLSAMPRLAFAQADYTNLQNIPDTLMRRSSMVELNVHGGQGTGNYPYDTMRLIAIMGKRMAVISLSVTAACTLSGCTFYSTWGGFTEHICRRVDCLTMHYDQQPMGPDENIATLSRPDGVGPLLEDYLDYSYLQIQTDRETESAPVEIHVFVPYDCYLYGQCARSRQLSDFTRTTGVSRKMPWVHG